jgi:lipopolysaccharide/colanic/teichoic acid biosynthesis glycosyltransferase
MDLSVKSFCFSGSQVLLVEKGNALVPLNVRSSEDPIGSPFDALAAADRDIQSEAVFRRVIAIERKRTERSKQPFLLMLLEAGNQPGSKEEGKALENMGASLVSSSRDTDVVGWYRDGITVGVLFTGLGSKDKGSILGTILTRVKSMLSDDQVPEDFSQVSISFHFFPDDWDHSNSGRPSNPALYPDLVPEGHQRRSLLVIKRAIDVVGSALALAICCPLFLVIAVAIKVSSKGPVLFRQQRVGQHGECFTFLKFRSMYVNNDQHVHQKFVTGLITNQTGPGHSDEKGNGVYKMNNDSRVTRVGKFLRRTSLDELPQLLNVLAGEMSLVGPRPAIPYELAAYQTWHRRRVLEAKPGITGAWQVAGRSRVQFDDMVRMDLRYAMAWTPWLDLKILLRTPLAVIRGSGAY